MTLPTVSVIIPTYNRKDSLLRTLESLARQTYPADRFEVIVVDDGGTDGTASITECAFPFALRYLRQENQGATVARNHGASQSRAPFLVFVDDDMNLHPTTLERLVGQQQPQTVVLGNLITPREIIEGSVFARAASIDQDKQEVVEEISFQNCMTGLLCLYREEFLHMGGFQDPTGGWPNWDDVDFGYRAYQAGYHLIRVHDALAEHWDYALSDWRSACQRWQRAGHSGARLFIRYPELRTQLPMFQDKGPIAWRQDSPSLILRKLARQIASSRLVMGGMEHVIPLLERHAPHSTALRLLYRWIVSGYIYRGYREGLRALAR